MNQRLRNKVAIVTGAGSIGPGWGNGKATAVLFAREGAKIFAVDLHREAAQETQSIIAEEGAECRVYEGDVSKASDVETMVKKCIETYGSIDILHNNVGIVEVGGPVVTSFRPCSVCRHGESVRAPVISTIMFAPDGLGQTGVQPKSG